MKRAKVTIALVSEFSCHHILTLASTLYNYSPFHWTHVERLDRICGLDEIECVLHA